MALKLHKLGIVAVVSTAFCFASASELQISVVPVFSGQQYEGSHSALAITVENYGRPAKGQLLVGDDVQTSYPLDLPHNRKQTFFAYPKISLYYDSSVAVHAVTDAGDAYGRFTTGMKRAGGYSAAIAIITKSRSHEPGMRFLATAMGEMEQVYAAPAMLPDRAQGYEDMGAVILGEGCEHMPDLQVRALQTYALTGGNVVFIGGLSSLILKDPRWKPYAPIDPTGTATVPGLTTKIRKTSYQLNSAIPITAGRLLPDATVLESAGGIPLAVSRSAGIGKVTFLAFDPFANPMVDWKMRGDYVLRILKVGDGMQRRATLEGSVGLYEIGKDLTPPPPPKPYVTTAGASNNPFNINLPQTATVVELLVAYVLLVVPINLLLLKKFNRGELAWITAPVLSLIFAGIFFRYAGNLYSAHLSKQTTSMIVADSDDPTSYALGRTQIFFPKAGSYDLHLQNVEVLESAATDVYNARSDQILGQSLTPVNIGDIVAHDMRVPNLSFYQFRFEQRMPQTRWLEAKLHLENGRISGTLNNASPYLLKSCELWRGETLTRCGDLAPGETRKIDAMMLPGDTSQTISSLSKGHLMAGATVIGAEPGAHIGTEITDPGAIRLIENIHPR
jgi:hypothetical protein